MLQSDEVNRIVNDAALSALKAREFRRVFHEPTIDSDGRDALHIVVVIEEGASERMDGDTVIDAIVNIQHRLTEGGEDRFPIIDFATESELQYDGGH